MAAPPLGTALTSPFPVPGGTARIHERGISITGQVGEDHAFFRFPMIGIPQIATGKAASAAVFDADSLVFQLGAWQMDGFLAALRAAVAARVALVPTGRASTPTQMVLGAPVVIVPWWGSTQHTHGVPVSAALQERTLYDVAVRLDDGTWHTIAPHTVYYRSSWHDFGIAHVTDIHVARRIDFYPGRLESLGRPEAARTMLNWNDTFRGFIRYANYLHDRGLLDVILATGDIIDFIYEDDDDPASGGNPAFARQLILGKWPSEAFPEVEELRVPIFITGGNHDYRKHTYRLLFNVDGGAVDLAEIANYSGYKLSRRDAIAISRGDRGDDVPELSTDSAKRAVEIDHENLAFRTHLADRQNYVVRLGAHRVVMLDSSWDVGTPDGILDAVITKAGLGPEDRRTFIAGSPNCEGVNEAELKMFADALAETPDDGLVIVGLHAPLFNPDGEEYPYYLRETQRAAQRGQAYEYLFRRGGHAKEMAVGTFPPGERIDGSPTIRRRHPTWFGADGSDAVSFVKRADNSDLLDYGVSRGAATDVLRAIAGIGSRRKADVVLSGHVHRFNEFRVANVDGEPVLFMDFYTQNLAHYYPTRFGGDDYVAYVDIVDDAPANNRPSETPSATRFKYVVTVPPYPKPLATASNPRAWWAEHRPLVLQTEALGPFKDENANLSGFRLLSVKNDVIEKIDLIRTETLRAAHFRIALEDVLKPDAQRAYIHSQRSREWDTATGTGTPFAYLIAANNTQNIIYRGSDNRFVELWRDAAGRRGAGNITNTAHAPAAGGDPSVYVDGAGNFVLPYRGTDGVVHALYWALTGPIGHDNLSGTAHSPAAAGNPIGYYNAKSGVNHVIYRSADGHLHAIYWKGTDLAQCEDLTGGGHLPKASGDPSPYVDQKRGTNIVVYRAADNHIRSVYWTDGPSGQDDLSGYAHAPNAAGDPFAYYRAADDSNQVVYRGADGHIHELWWVGEAPVSHWDLSAPANAPPAASDPAAWYNAAANKKHVAYRGTDGHIHDLSWTPGGGVPAHVDLSLEAFAQPAASGPTAFSGPTHQHVVYRGTDNRIHEIRWPEGSLVSMIHVAYPPVFTVMTPGTT